MPLPTGRSRLPRRRWSGRPGCWRSYGDTARRFALASVTKPLVARAAQVAIEEGVVELDTPAGPPGSTVRHLLAHTSGLSMRTGRGPGGAGQASDLLQLRVRRARRDRATGVGHRVRPTTSREAVFEPLGMASSDSIGGAEAAGFGAESTVADLAVFAVDLLRPALVSEQMHAEATTVQFPGLAGVLPGFGAQRPNDWGLGFEIRDGKSPHWTGSANSGAHLRPLRPIGHVHLGGSRR